MTFDAARLSADDAAQAARCLAAAERAVEEGRLNSAKVLRAVAHAFRARSLAFARLEANEAAAIDALGEAVSHEERVAAALTSAPASAAARDALAASRQLASILQRSVDALAETHDVPEGVVAQFLWGCHDCGAITEGARPEICEFCGSVAGDHQMFAPFFSATPERLARRTPAEVTSMLAGDTGRLRDALAGVGEERLRRVPPDGEWCMKQVAGHMIDVAGIFCRRVRSAIEPDAAIPPETTPMPWLLVHEEDYAAMSVDALVERFRSVTGDALALVGRLAEADWRRTAEMLSGQVRVIDLGSWLANHNVAHVQQIMAMREEA